MKHTRFSSRKFLILTFDDAYTSTMQSDTTFAFNGARNLPARKILNGPSLLVLHEFELMAVLDEVPCLEEHQHPIFIELIASPSRTTYKMSVWRRRSTSSA